MHLADPFIQIYLQCTQAIHFISRSYLGIKLRTIEQLQEHKVDTCVFMRAYGILKISLGLLLSPLMTSFMARALCARRATDVHPILFECMTSDENGRDQTVV